MKKMGRRTRMLARYMFFVVNPTGHSLKQKFGETVVQFLICVFYEMEYEFRTTKSVSYWYQSDDEQILHLKIYSTFNYSQPT